MAAAEEPFNLVPSCSHHFYLGFPFLRMGSSEKKNWLFLSLKQKAERGKCVCGVWEVKTGRRGRRSLADANATLTN